MLQARSGHGSPEKPRLRAKLHAAKRIAVRRRRKKPTSSPAWYYHTINEEKRQEFCPKNWQESKFLSSRHKFSQKNRRKTAKKHPAPTKTPPKTSLKMFHMKLSRELPCFTWNYKQSMRHACFYQKIYPQLHINVSYETFAPLASRQDEMFYSGRNKLDTRQTLSSLYFTFCAYTFRLRSSPAI